MPNVAPPRRARIARLDRFAGLSDREVPVGLTRIESPDLRNVEFAEAVLAKRNGWQRMHTDILRDCSIRLNGANPISNQLGQYVRIPNLATTYAPTNKLFLMVDVVMREVRDVGASPDESFILSRGHGTSTNRFLSISWEPDTPGWTLRARDTNGGGADRVVTLTDGSANTDILDQYRRLEVECTNTGTDEYTFRALNSAGTTVDSGTFTLVTWQTDGNLGSATGWVLGADQDSTGAALTDTYSACTLANFAIWDASSQPTYFAVAAASRVERDLDNSPTATDEFTNLTGYWKFNDGKGNTLQDSSTNSNEGIIGGEGPQWVSDPALGAGPSALEFFGEDGAVRWSIPGGTANVFGVANYTARRWAFTFLLVPRMDAGETTVRDQTIFWTGTHAINPGPIGAVIDSNDFTADRLTILYLDGSGTAVSATIAVDLSTLVNKRCRVWVAHNDLAGGDQLTANLIDIDATPSVSYNATPAATDGANGTHSNTASVCRNFSSFVLPYAYQGYDYGGAGGAAQSANAGRCVISDIAFFRVQTNNQGYGPYMNAGPLSQNNQYATAPLTFNQTIQTGFGYATETIDLVAGLPLDDGQGTRPRTFGTLSALNNKAYIIPELDSGVLWDLGITDPFDPPEIDGIFDYRRATNDGGFQRSLLVVSGSTGYEITGLEDGVGNATANPVFAGLHKGGKCTFSQLQNTVYIGRPNGKRPRKWNGTYLDWVGIEAPSSPPDAAQATTGTGSLTSGSSYWIYVTYRNKETGVESNPSPGFQVSITGGNDSIGAVQIPVSPDPQVNQRRLWISAADAAEDVTPLYLAENASEEAVIDDNVAVSYATGIDRVDTNNASITDLDANSPPPAGSLVRTFKDRLWVSGNPVFPTRLHYSGVLTPDLFDGTDYLDLDQDTGDRITGLGRLLNRLVVFMRDGRIQISASGQDATPFFASVTSRDSGAVGPQAYTEYEGVVPHLSERDIFIWDGGQPLNISSPNSGDRPSIQDTVRTGLQTQRLANASMAVYRDRDQMWLAVSSSGQSRNDTILVYDFERGTWSRHDIDADCLSEVEDANDDPKLYAGIRGHLCLLDSGAYDGIQTTAIAGTATAGDTESLTDTGQSLTVDLYKGMYLVWYDVDTNTVYRSRIRKNTATQFFTYDAITAPASGDPYVIGGIQWYADFLLSFGNPMRMKKLHWFRAAGESDSDGNRIRVQLVKDQPQRDSASAPWNASGNSPTEYIKLWPDEDKYMLLPVGGIGRSFRLRVSDTGYASAASEQAVPMGGRIKIFEFEVEAEELGVQ